MAIKSLQKQEMDDLARGDNPLGVNGGGQKPDLFGAALSDPSSFPGEAESQAPGQGPNFVGTGAGGVEGLRALNALGAGPSDAQGGIPTDRPLTDDDILAQLPPSQRLRFRFSSTSANTRDKREAARIRSDFKSRQDFAIGREREGQREIQESEAQAGAQAFELEKIGERARVTGEQARETAEAGAGLTETRDTALAKEKREVAAIEFKQETDRLIQSGDTPFLPDGKVNQAFIKPIQLQFEQEFAQSINKQQQKEALQKLNTKMELLVALGTQRSSLTGRTTTVEGQTPGGIAEQIDQLGSINGPAIDLDGSGSVSRSEEQASSSVSPEQRNQFNQLDAISRLKVDPLTGSVVYRGVEMDATDINDAKVELATLKKTLSPEQG